MKLQWKLFLIVAVSTVVMITVLNLLLSGSLRAKDLAVAKRNARQTALLIRSGLLNTMINTGEYDKIASVLADMRRDQKFEFRMVRSEHVVRQHGMKRGETPRDDLERMALRTGDVIETQDSEAELRIIFPFITDERCGQCHVGIDGEPVPPGVINGLAVISFDLNEQKEESASVTRKMMLTLTLVILLLMIIILSMVYTTVTQPMQTIADAITGFREERFDIGLPTYTTHEIKIVADKVLTSASQLARRKREREATIEKERARNAEIQRFVQSRARAMGLADDSEVSSIISRLSQAVDEAEKADLIVKAFKYVVHGESKLSLPSDPNLISAVSLYLGEMVEAVAETIKKRSIELALDEALANAIYHGNLEAPSNLKEEDFESFNELVGKRLAEAPYASRKVEVTYVFDHSMAKFIIKDEGPGFDWRGWMGDAEADQELPHGRGLLIIKTLASAMEFNDKGNQMTISFDLTANHSA